MPNQMEVGLEPKGSRGAENDLVDTTHHERGSDQRQYNQIKLLSSAGWGGDHDVTHLAAHLLLFLGGPRCHDLGSIGTSGEVGEESSADIVLFPYQRCSNLIARGGLTCAR